MKPRDGGPAPRWAAPAFFFFFAYFFILVWNDRSLHPAAGYQPVLLLYPAFLLVDVLLTVILVWAWSRRLDRADSRVAYVLIAAMLLHMIAWAHLFSDHFWAFRGVGFLGGFFPPLWFGCLALMHPAYARPFVQRISRAGERIRLSPRALTPIAAAALIALFWTLRSHHITRDGVDWIQRTAQPVWHLYLREPLTIGLYRWTWLAVKRIAPVTPYDVIAALSVAAGAWACLMYWFTLRRMALSPRACAAGVMLAATTGGWMILNFGHIEVYPVLVAGLMTAFYFAARYLRDGRGALAVGAALSVVFLLHLSTGWLLPAFIALPFIARGREGCRDALVLAGVFAAIQLAFWGALIVFAYGADLSRFLARLYETFHVGPDRAMFASRLILLHPWRLMDLANEYVYLMTPALILLPLTIRRAMRRPRRQHLFWALCFVMYGAYSFFWNADRGFPEDWDLFSPLAMISVLFTVNLLLSDDDLSEDRGVLIAAYLTAMASAPLAIAQIAYHHFVSFRPPAM
ncbi:MAG: hypothetical protein GC154_12310 [bacterium]|nr:hypothetical protein [bacterium]